MPAPVIDEDVDAGYWRARAGRAEALVAELRAENAGLNARVAELAGQVAALQESVTTLSGLLFGSSSEKGGSPARRTGREGGDRPGGAGKRGQRPGGPGHGRRDYSHLETEERVIDVDAGQRCCAVCGKAFEFIGTEDSEQIDWQVKITRIVWRRRRYRRRCSHPGPATACAPPAARPVPKGLFTAGFLARLAYEKHVLGRPVHRIVQALAADGLDVAAGTLCGALKQVAPLIAPWAEAIAAHGRTAGHVHADETSWQVFEDIEDKDGHRWWLWVFAAPRGAVSYRSRSGQGWEELSLDLMANSESERIERKIACQETGGRAQAYGAACREIRVIWRELDCPNPSLQKVQPHARRKDACNRRRPLWRCDEFTAVILRGAGAMSCQDIQGDERDA